MRGYSAGSRQCGTTVLKLVLNICIDGGGSTAAERASETRVLRKRRHVCNTDELVLSNILAHVQ